MKSAKKVLAGVSVIEGYFLDVDLPQDNFDVVMSFQVLEHVVSPRLFLEKVFRVLKKGGAYGHSVGQSPAFAYANTGYNAVGTALEIEILGLRCKAKVFAEATWDTKNEQLKI